MKRGQILLVFVVGLAFGLGSILFVKKSKASPPRISEVRAGLKGLVNPLMDCSTQSSNDTSDKIELKAKLQGLIDKLQSDGELQWIGIYLDDLNKNSDFGMSSNDHFVGGSLLKLPVLMGLLRKSESDPQFLDRKLVFDPSLTSTDVFGQSLTPPSPLTPGQSYSVKELIERMIIDSDNVATRVLQAGFPEIDIVRIADEIGVSVVVENNGAWVTPEQYTTILRVLFNATFLNPEKSDWALSLLTQSKFKDGLVAGVPAQIKVAHKFGERSENGVDYFHDCGIIYSPGHPYVLCVMTRGKNQKHQVVLTAEISKLVYEFMQREPVQDSDSQQ